VRGAQRCFFALPLQSEALDALQHVQHRLGAAATGVWPALRWLRAGQLHVTLKFLGSIAEDALPTLIEALEREARCTPRIATAAAALSAFPVPRRAGVLVLRLDDPGGVLATLAAALERAAQRVGVPPERRPFKAHVTLARSKPPSDVRALIAEHAFEPQPLVFDELRLYASLLRPTGSEYTVLAAAPLAG
jgi:2'-5' RNA ligase